MSTVVIDEDFKKSAHFKRYCEMILYHWRHGHIEQTNEWLSRFCYRYGFDDLNIDQFIVAISI